MGWPVEGLLFDVEHNVLWLDEWGTRPPSLEHALAEARAFLEQQAKLVPVYGHRYLPTVPSEVGNPVLSVYQSDIIVYGENLLRYFENELEREYRLTEPIRSVPFWSRFID